MVMFRLVFWSILGLIVFGIYGYRSLRCCAA
jgi:hypothetical protein